MTASEQMTTPAPPAERSPNWLAYGTGLGIAIEGENLAVAVARVRNSHSVLKAATVIENFRQRPAAEWGAELTRFLAGSGAPHLAATISLPREEVIVRPVQLPGVTDREVTAALELQIETLHPYGDEDVAWAWLRVRPETILVGLTRKASLEFWETLFVEAGVPLAAITFSPAAIYSALRIWGAAPASSLLYVENSRGRTEIYGESEARAVYSMELAMPRERVIAAARAELRLPFDSEARTLLEALPSAGSGVTTEYSPLAWAAALVAAAPFTTRVANFIPKERRASNARRQYLLTAILAGAVVLGLLGAFVIFPALERRNYLSALSDEIRRLDPAAKHAQALEQQAAAARARIGALDEIRRRPQADLDVLAELTRILPAQVWTNAIEIYPDSVIIAGEADQAAPLLKLLDSSPLFQNSEFALSVTRNAKAEQFRIKSLRRNRVGRTTP